MTKHCSYNISMIEKYLELFKYIYESLPGLRPEGHEWDVTNLT